MANLTSIISQLLVVIAVATIICGGDGLYLEGAMIPGPKTEGLRGLITIRGQIRVGGAGSSRKLMALDGASRGSTEKSMAAAAFLPAESKDQQETGETKEPAETRLEPGKQGPGNWHVRESLHYVPSSPDPIQNR